jgi:hypothetical protein
VHFYKSLAYRVGSAEALELAERLEVWHDAMVSHERVQRRQDSRSCPPECPHTDVADLWREAQHVFGRAADELVFLRTRAIGTTEPVHAA